MLDQKKTESFKGHFSGEIILPGEAEYDKASSVLVSQGQPAIVVRPLDAKDVAAAISFARENKLDISIKSGGHSNAGLGTNNGGLVIDLGHLNSVELLNPEKNIVKIGPGATWGSVAHTLQQFSLAISSGDVKTVGVGGLATAGGIGWMVRKHGLTIDNLVGAEVVLADGRTVRADENTNPDLFWAIRGCGGNFGIVTSFEFTAHKLGKVYFGSISYDFSTLKEALTGWRDYMRTAPEELTTMFLVMPTNPAFGNQPPAALALVCYAGDKKEEADKALEPLLKLGKVTAQDIQEKEYGEILGDAHMPQGMKIIVNNSFFKEFSDEAIETITRQGGPLLQIRSVGKAMNRVPTDATAFAHRDSEVLIVCPTFLPSDASAERIQKAQTPWQNIAKSGHGSYLNFLSEVTEKNVASVYPKSTYRKLSEIKKKYDPENIFNKNFNIKPAA